jgi:hypothetical protein
MRRRAAAALVVLSLAVAGPAKGHAITLSVAGADGRLVSCAISLVAGWITAVESTGHAAPGARPLRWRADAAEIQVFAQALQALLTGDLATTDPRAAILPVPPYLTATWVTTLDGHSVGGRYMQDGTDPPDPLAAMVATILPGGLCAGALAP